MLPMHYSPIQITTIRNATVKKKRKKIKVLVGATFSPNPGGGLPEQKVELNSAVGPASESEQLFWLFFFFFKLWEFFLFF